MRRLSILFIALLIAPGCAFVRDGALAWPETVNHPGGTWWWAGSAVDRGNITWNLETLRAAGIGGASIVPIYGVKGCEDRFIPYLSSEWLAMLDHPVREAGRPAPDDDDGLKR